MPVPKINAYVEAIDEIIRNCVEQIPKRGGSYHVGLFPNKSIAKNEGLGYSESTQWLPTVKRILSAIDLKYKGANLLNDQSILDLSNKTFKCDMKATSYILAEMVLAKAAQKSVHDNKSKPRFMERVRSYFGRRQSA